MLILPILCLFVLAINHMNLITEIIFSKKYLI